MGNSTSYPELSEFYPAMEEAVKAELALLKDCKAPAKITYDEFVHLSSKFPVKFPIETARISQQKSYTTQELEEYINSAYPIMHEKLITFLAKFIYIKKHVGSKKEKEIYGNMHILDLVERLIKKRPMVFVGSHDSYVLFDETFGMGDFNLIGSDKENPKLSINQYMTYDEIKLAALMSVSSKTHFINNGSRKNNGELGADGTFEKSGVIVGQVGARFQKQHLMDWQDCVVTQNQNNARNGYGAELNTRYLLLREWSHLWGLEYFPTWDQVINGDAICADTIFQTLRFNEKIYSSRMKIPIEILLQEATTRGVEANKKVYLHIVGLGLGEWRLIENQAQLYVNAWGDVLENIDCRQIDSINFSWINVESCNGIKNGEKYKDSNVNIYFSKRSLHDPVPEGLLLVCNFAWDGNSLPGNEYWAGSLSTSGDPAAACSSGIAELHNTFINPNVAAHNLHVATESGIIHVSEYAKSWLQSLSET